jgi:hypothetical protein
MESVKRVNDRVEEAGPDLRLSESERLRHRPSQPVEGMLVVLSAWLSALKHIAVSRSLHRVFLPSVQEIGSV